MRPHNSKNGVNLTKQPGFKHPITEITANQNTPTVNVVVRSIHGAKMQRMQQR